jgi:hypothetical protein
MALERKGIASVISRRDAFAGFFGTIAAPFVIRTPGLLMPIRDRTSQLDEMMWGLRDYRRYPPTVEEVIDWRRGVNAMNARSMMVSWTGEGFNRIFAMSDAEKHYRAMGLI